MMNTNNNSNTNEVHALTISTTHSPTTAPDHHHHHDHTSPIINQAQQPQTTHHNHNHHHHDHTCKHHHHHDHNDHDHHHHHDDDELSLFSMIQFIRQDIIPFFSRKKLVKWRRELWSYHQLRSLYIYSIVLLLFTLIEFMVVFFKGSNSSASSMTVLFCAIHSLHHWFHYTIQIIVSIMKRKNLFQSPNSNNNNNNNNNNNSHTTSDVDSSVIHIPSSSSSSQKQEKLQQQAYSYGYGRMEVILHFSNCVFALFAACAICTESIHSLAETYEDHHHHHNNINNNNNNNMNNNQVIVVNNHTGFLSMIALIGFFINFIGVYMFNTKYNSASASSSGTTSVVARDNNSSSSASSSSVFGHRSPFASPLSSVAASGAATVANAVTASPYHSLMSPSSHNHAYQHYHHSVPLLKSSHQSNSWINRTLTWIQIWIHKQRLFIIECTREAYAHVALLFALVLLPSAALTVYFDVLSTFVLSGMLIYYTWPTIERAARVLLQTTPDRFKASLNKCVREASFVEGVLECYGEHFWSIGMGPNSSVIGTVKVRISNEANEQVVLQGVKQVFQQRSFISNLTIQVEKDNRISRAATPHFGGISPVYGLNIADLSFPMPASMVTDHSTNLPPKLSAVVHQHSTEEEDIQINIPTREALSPSTLVSRVSHAPISSVDPSEHSRDNSEKTE